MKRWVIIQNRDRYACAFWRSSPVHWSRLGDESKKGKGADEEKVRGLFRGILAAVLAGPVADA
ncbi:hypothetical protein Poly59_32780 [Rubripirellula reticaptiva]|uniref:Uncharacterized protein n=1 Tax=Rubripirellula reticaptiva TaxID=2528013 RepID=A0A5C6EPL6_9BACT|nr:hypothetical protein Poly59_32780 [Rubripirellula reticaptiva]